MSGLNISCGEFQADEKSGSAFEPRRVGATRAVHQTIKLNT